MYLSNILIKPLHIFKGVWRYWRCWSWWKGAITGSDWAKARGFYGSFGCLGQGWGHGQSGHYGPYIKCISMVSSSNYWFNVIKLLMRGVMWVWCELVKRTMLKPVMPKGRITEQLVFQPSSYIYDMCFFIVPHVFQPESGWIWKFQRNGILAGMPAKL